MMEEKETTIELGAIFTLIKRNILLIIIVVLAFAILGFTASKCLMQEKYQAEATLIVNNIADTSKRVTNDEITSAKQLVNTYAVILTSDTVMDQVIDNLELRSIPKWKNITAKTLGTSVVKVSQVNETQAIKVTAITPDPDLSQDIVGEVVALAPETIIETVKAGSVETISGAKAQRTPVSPDLKKNMAISGMLGLVAVMGFLIVRMLLDNTFKTDEDIRDHLGLDVLGILPAYEGKAGKK